MFIKASDKVYPFTEKRRQIVEKKETEMPEKIEPWKVVFTATDRSFNIIECPECYNQCLCSAVVDYAFCPYCGGLRLQDDDEN